MQFGAREPTSKSAPSKVLGRCKHQVENTATASATHWQQQPTHSASPFLLRIVIFVWTFVINFGEWSMILEVPLKSYSILIENFYFWIYFYDFSLSNWNGADYLHFVNSSFCLFGLGWVHLGCEWLNNAWLLQSPTLINPSRHLFFRWRNWIKRWGLNTVAKKAKIACWFCCWFPAPWLLLLALCSSSGWANSQASPKFGFRSQLKFNIIHWKGAKFKIGNLSKLGKMWILD